jgi:hypothetical protein
MISQSINIGASRKTSSSVLISHGTTPFVTAYNWTYGSGFGTKYADPASSIGGAGIGMGFNPNQSAIVIGTNATPYINAYAWTKNAGFGTKYSNPSTLPSGTPALYGLEFTKQGDAVAAAASATPYVHAYAWTTASGFGTKYANPSSLVGTDVRDIAFNRETTYAVIGLGGAQVLNAYAWTTASGFGTRITQPAGVAGNVGTEVKWSKDGSLIWASSDASPFVMCYPWTGSTWGTKYANPVSGPITTQFGGGMTVNPNESVGFVCGYYLSGSVPQFGAVKFNKATGWGTRYANPASVVLNNQGNGFDISADGNAVVCGLAASPYVAAYQWNDTTGFGTKYSNPGSAIAGGANRVLFN